MTDEMSDLMPEGPEGEEVPQNEAETQETPQEALGATESILRIEYVDDGAEKIDVAILAALGGDLEATDEETEEELPEAWEMPTGEKKVAVMIPKRGEGAPSARNGEEVENGPNNGS